MRFLWKELVLRLADANTTVGLARYFLRVLSNKFFIFSSGGLIAEQGIWLKNFKLIFQFYRATHYLVDAPEFDFSDILMTWMPDPRTCMKMMV